MAVLGIAVGSFLNVVSDRWPLRQSIIRPGSRCPHCSQRLSFIENVPLLSYLWLRGRCRHCGGPIAKRVPLVEALTGAVFAYVGFTRGLSTESVVLLFFLSVMIAIFVIDLEHGLILNIIIFPTALIALLVAPFAPAGDQVGAGGAYLNALAGAGLGFGILLVLSILASLTVARGRTPMGEGDLKMAAVMGLMLGYELIFVAFWFAFLLGGVIAVLVLLRIRRLHAEIPFGPALAIGTSVALVWGWPILDWYQGLFGS